MIPMTNIARIVGLLAAFVAGTIVKVASAHGITLDTSEMQVVLTTVMLGVYALVHRVISKKSNPQDVAAPEIRRELAGEPPK